MAITFWDVTSAGEAIENDGGRWAARSDVRGLQRDFRQARSIERTLTERLTDRINAIRALELETEHAYQRNAELLREIEELRKC